MLGFRGRIRCPYTDSMQRTRQTLAAIFTGGSLAVLLTSCGAGLSQGAWEYNVSKSEAVLSAEWDYTNPWPTSEPFYTGSVTLDSAITEAEAREVAELSCRSHTDFQDIYFTVQFPEQELALEKRGFESSCFDSDELVNFARILEAARTQGKNFSADILVWSHEEERDDDTGERVERPPRILIEATSGTQLFDFLEASHAAVGKNGPFSFTGSVDDDASLTTDSDEEIDVEVSAGFDLKPVVPVLEASSRLEHNGIVYAEKTNTVVVALKSPADKDSEEAHELGTQAAKHGVTLDLRLADTPYGEPETAEVRELLLKEIKQLEFVESAELDSYFAIEVTVQNRQGIDEVLKYFAKNDGERANDLNRAHVNGTDLVSLLIRVADEDAVSVHIDGSVPDIDEFRQLSRDSLALFEATPTASKLHVQAWSDKERVYVTFDGQPEARDSWKQMFDFASVDRVEMTSSDGKTEHLERPGV